MPRMTLGAFTLHDPIAEGGMGVVWRASHTALGVPVAVKVLSPSAWKRATHLEQFRNEVRAVARLDHPSIIAILDQDTISAEAARDSRRQLVAGSPYLVMELASAGSLDSLSRDLSWRELRSILLAILDALAHAHARGVVHRDIKPANILLCTGKDLRPGIKLTDWGIAHALGQGTPHRRRERAGTLHFMAPEQVSGDWHAQGPHTDLYGLGCLAYRLATGKLPFAGLRGDALAAAQYRKAPPPLVPRMPVVPGFAAWVDCLMSKRPEDRFPSAAEAAHGLRALGMPPQAPRLVSFRRFADAQPLIIGARASLDPEPSQDVAMVPSYQAGQAVPETTQRGLPADWRSPAPPAPTPALVSAGLGLWGLRAVPISGRQAERDALWGLLREVQERGEVRATCLVGPAGYGKSALCRWLSERAQEVGGVTALTVMHSETEGPDAALRRALARALRVEDLEGDDLTEALAAKMPAGEATAVARLLGESQAAEASALERKLRAREHRSTLVQALRRLGRGQPVLLVLEDVQWSEEASSLTRAILQASQERPFPLLAILTARSEDLASRPMEAEALGSLDLHTIEVGPLPQEDLHHLVQHLLDLDAAAAAQLQQLAGGSPLFVIQLVDDWVRRGALEPGPRGLQLTGEMPHIPDNLHLAWSRHVEEVLDGLPRGARAMLERCALLGAVVDGAEWKAIGTTGPAAPRCAPSTLEELRRRLIHRRLAREDGTGIAFTHSLFREAVCRSSEEGKRAVAHHRAAARMLSDQYPEPSPPVAERMGRHALEAGDLDTALPLLFQAVEERRHRGNYRSALALVERLFHALDAAGVPASEARRGELALRAATLHRLQGDYRGAEARITALLAEAASHAWEDRAIEATIEHATIRLHLDDTAGGRAIAEAVVERLPDGHPLLASALYVAAAAAGDAWDFEAQEALHRRAADAYRAQGDEVGWADCQRDRGNHFLRRGDLDAAGPLFSEALPVYESHALRLGIAHTVNGLAEIARKRGDLDAAAKGYERSIALFDAIGGGQSTIPLLNLALIWLGRRDWHRARATVEPAMETLQRQGRKGLVAAAHSLLLPTYAAAGDWADWDRAKGRLDALLDETGIVARDLAWALEKAAEVALDQGHRRRAGEVRALAHAQYLALKDEAGAARTA